MKIARVICTVLLALMLVGPALAGEGHKCSEDTQTCLNMMAQKLKSRGWVGIEYDQDEETGKMVITRVVPDGPAMDAGMQEGDVLVAFNGLEFAEENKEKMYAAMKAMTPGRDVAYTVNRKGCCHKKGGMTDLTVTLGELPEDVLAQWVGQHMLEHAAIEVARQ